ncbi:2-hydroxyacid dehydrogenase [Salinibius halmophilus]|uniref:2-hydroxyacid dehydrogenase n=1 Tax=Salinibius halmophilus TaxID=1853216 RepID=UPI000E662FBB|nr:2-hydroxyacid dehydrogenase [Salinibius halmophilus]
MKVAVFSAKPYDQTYLGEINQGQHELEFFEPHLDSQTVPLTKGFDVVCCFVNDTLDRDTLVALKDNGIKLVAMRCAGFNNVDLPTAEQLELPIVRVPEYSPYAVAEHAAALALSLNRNLHRAHNRVRENDYSLDGLLGFDFNGKTVGVIGTGKIGVCFGKIMQGFGCKVVAYDPYPSNEAQKLGFEFLDLDTLLNRCDVISLHCPLMSQTYHIINAYTISKMKRGVMLLNTSRGGLIDTPAVIEGLKSGQIGHVGLDVYEEEEDLFFEDYSNNVLQDDTFARLQTFPNVIITGHQAFFTKEALTAIAKVTFSNLNAFAEGRFEDMHQVTTGK